jgi:ATP phosphoribosyltransferase
MAKTIYVNCVFCEGMMEINAETGEVIQKWAPEEKDASKDKMSSALQKLQEAKEKRSSLFNVKKEELESQKKKAEDLFKKQVEKAKKEGVTENPIRPFDLD